MYLLPEDFEDRLKTEIIGHPFYVYSTLDSTQTTAKYMAESGAKEGTVVFAYSQKKGRGKEGRWWYSPSGGVWFTIILRPSFPAHEANRLNVAFTVAICEVLSSFENIQPVIKWPNDILLKGKKLCGILTQMRSSSNSRKGIEGIQGGIEYALVGVGINLNIEREKFPPPLKEKSTSLMEEVGQEIVPSDFLCSVLKEMDRYYLMLKEERFPEIQEKWYRFSLPAGSLVKTISSTYTNHGQLMGTNEKGNLMVRYPHGQIEEIITGEIEILTY